VRTKNTINLAQQDSIIGRNPRKSYAGKNEAAWQGFTSYASPASSAISDYPPNKAC